MVSLQGAVTVLCRVWARWTEFMADGILNSLMRMQFFLILIFECGITEKRER